MDAEKYRRQIPIHCPTCGCSQFKYDSGVDETIQVMECASCGRNFSREELLRENSENVSAHLDEIKQEVVQDVRKEVQNMFKKAFSGSKHIKFKIK